MKRFRYEYGDSPLHLLTALAVFVVSAWAFIQVFGAVGKPENVVKWFVGALVLHDLIFLPLYAALGVLVAWALMRNKPRDRLRMAALNHLRVPAILSALAFLVWYPMILAKSNPGFERATGLTKDAYLGKWLLLCAVLFAGSALLFAFRARGLKRPG